MYRKFVLFAMALLMMVTALAACGTTKEPTAAPAKEVTLLWGFWGGPAEQATHEKVAQAFMAEHPNIKFDYFYAPWDDYFTKLKTLWAGGDAKAIPDVLFLWPTPSYAAKGVLEDLTPYIQKSGYDLNDYWPNLLESASYNGKVYGFPRDIDVQALYYNKKLLDAAGVAYPTDNWTWDDLLAAVQKLTVKDASGRVTQYGLGMEGGKWPVWVGQAGGMVLDSLTNPSKCTLDTPEAMKGLQFFYDLMNDEYAMRSATLSSQGGDAAVFQTGQVAMIIQNSSRVSGFNADANLDYDVAPVPIPAGGQRWDYNGGAAWVISSGADDKETAWEFLKWLQSSGGGESMYTKSGEIFPALQSVANSQDFLGVAKPANRKAFITEGQASKPGGFGYFPEWDELNGSIIEPALQKLWAGEGTPDQVVPELCTAVNQFLANNGYPKK